MKRLVYSISELDLDFSQIQMLYEIKFDILLP